MAETTRHPVQAWIMSNPCFYLFAVLLLLLILLPLFEDSDAGKLWFMVMNLLVLVSPVVVLSRGRFFWGTLLLAGAACGLLVAFHVTGGSCYLTWSERCSVGVFVVTDRKHKATFSPPPLPPASAGGRCALAALAALPACSGGRPQWLAARQSAA